MKINNEVIGYCKTCRRPFEFNYIDWDGFKNKKDKYITVVFSCVCSSPNHFKRYKTYEDVPTWILENIIKPWINNISYEHSKKIKHLESHQAANIYNIVIEKFSKQFKKSLCIGKTKEYRNELEKYCHQFNLQPINVSIQEKQESILKIIKEKIEVLLNDIRNKNGTV